ncbi:hypothetical protein AB6N23_00520 [Cellulomonas sp. 179-A 9B4 NHS]|uniref:hypothetical protein n=1 Tax=Cellulomonas sp. 179-A 9B4 NHS TaxID=3142379 RepID=UPI0039A0D708
MIARRTVLQVGAGIGLAVALPLERAAAAPVEPLAEPLAGALRTVPVEGSGLRVRLLGGDAATVLTHVARRFHYEVRPVTSFEGHRPAPEGDDSARALHHAAGTAVHVDPSAYPVGVGGTLHPHETTALRAVLADCDGLVVWGGDDPDVPCEGHLRLAVPADDPAVHALAERLAATHGRPAEAADDATSPQALARSEGVRAAGAAGA